MAVLESVPNVSEGRSPAVVAELRRAAEEGGAAVLDVHSDPDHNRSVFSLAARADEALGAALFALVRRAVDLIDLRIHEGIHPRVGAADVIPVVPLTPGDGDRAEHVAGELARRIGSELEIPVFQYGVLAGGKRPAFFRRGGPAELQRRIDAGELFPDCGPRQLHLTAGAALVGVRAPLVAFNLDLATGDLDAARAIAAAVRESSGGMPGVQAIGLLVAGAGRAQVSTNIVDVERVDLHEVVARVHDEAAARGTAVVRGELVGLLPERVVRKAAGLAGGTPVDERARARAAAALALEHLPASAILEQRLAACGLLDTGAAG
jgi:glutamate formiminotransferase